MRVLALASLLCLAVSATGPQAPRFIRIFPLGLQLGNTESVEILGERLSNVTGVEFDSKDLVWKKTTFSSPHRLTGEVWVSASAAPGLHSARVRTLDGSTNSGLLNISPWKSVREVEPNDSQTSAFPIPSVPVDIQGRLDGAPDADVFSFTVQAGQRLVFDLKSIDDGSAVEARMILLDADGHTILFNDDRDDYNENPLIEHVFPTAGTYYIKLDQYRGPRGFNFGKLSSYILRVGDTPRLASAQPRALKRGSQAVLRLSGSGLTQVRSAALVELRQAEYRRMTYPYTMPIHFRADPSTGAETKRIAGVLRDRSASELEIAFRVDGQARPGLWRLWLTTASGPIDMATIEITELPLHEEESIKATDLPEGEFLIAGSLSTPGETDRYRVNVRAGRSLQFRTIAEQMGVSHLDSVLTLRDTSGKKLAENDDVVAGQGTLLGNPDSRVFYTPDHDGVVIVEVRDRTGRGGSGYEYVLKADYASPGFQLFTTPENFVAVPGQTAEVKAHLVREAGFQGEVDIWAEGLPDGVRSSNGRFRADQLFEPNADGADMIIPEITLRIEVPASTPTGRYAFKVLGAPTSEAAVPARRITQAHATLMLGPLLDPWNFVRRPLPEVTLEVVPAPVGTLCSRTRNLRLQQGKSATVELELEGVPSETVIEFLDLPLGVRSRLVERKGAKSTYELQADEGCRTGKYEFSAEAKGANRRIPSPTFSLTIENGHRN